MPREQPSHRSNEYGVDKVKENSSEAFVPDRHDDEWSLKEILVVVICVLCSLLLFLFMCQVYLCYKNRRKRNINQRNGSIPTCVCRQASCCRLVATGDIQAGPNISVSPISPNCFYGPAVHSCQSLNRLSRIRSAADVLPDHHGQCYTGQTQAFSTTVPGMNPVYEDSFDEFDSVHAIDVRHGALKDLFKVTERSITQTVSGKLLVSIAREVSHKGDVLYLDNMGISLHVPEGAIKRGNTELIVLVLDWDLSDNPQMKKEESLVSPVVYVGPHGLVLDKTCTLTFRHCAFNPHQIQVMCSETELTDQKAWSALCERADDTEVCYFTPDECQLKIDTFTLFTCVQAPLDDCLGKKWLQIAVFACPLRKEINHHQVRLYFLNKTNCALQWAIQNEANFGGKLICPEKVFLFSGNELDMFTVIRYVSNGWEPVGGESSEKISFQQIWHGQCPHVSVCLRRTDVQPSRPTSFAIEMSLRVFTFQQTQEENGEKIFIQVFEDNRTPVSEKEVRCNHQIEIQINNYGNSHGGPNFESNTRNKISEENTSVPDTVPPGSDFQRVNANTSENIQVVINNKFSPPSDRLDRYISVDGKQRLFPQYLRNRLILLLDPTKAPYGQDWKDLAAKLNMDACIPKLQTCESPTSELLHCLECQGKSYTDVINLFEEIGRLDCADEMRKFRHTAANNSTSREASENTHSGDELEEVVCHSKSSFSGSCDRYWDGWLSENTSQNGLSDTFSKNTFESKD